MKKIMNFKLNITNYDYKIIERIFKYNKNK